MVGDNLETVKLLLSTTDAQVWAREWCRIARRLVKDHGAGGIIDQEWMTGWFANAIETGRDAGARAALSNEGRELNEAKAENARLRTNLEAVRKLRDEAIEAASVMSTRLDDLDAQLEAVRELVSTYDANHADWIVTRTAILAALSDEGGDDGNG